MPRIVTFADGFVSASEPPIEGSEQETYSIANNTTDDIFTINSEAYKSAFADYELIRKDDSNEYIQAGKISLFYDGVNWNYALGISNGSDLIVSDIESPEQVKLTISTLAGVGTLSYESGNMTGTNYVGSFKIFITRISVL